MHLYLNPVQRERIYKEARTRFNMGTATDRQVEERLADEFALYVQSNGKVVKDYPAGIKGFFRNYLTI